MITIITKNKITFLFILVLLILFLLTGCGSPATDAPAGEAEEALPEEEIVEEAEETLFTMEEIVQFDGQDGRPAYIVVDGIVYDVTDVGQWRSGSHFGFEAGTDVTEALASAAPHGAGQLGQAEIVGRIAE